MIPDTARTHGAPPDILTFRHVSSGKMVYVLPAADYTVSHCSEYTNFETHASPQAALSLVREVFPEIDAKTNQISFSITSLVQNKQNPVAISPEAWSAVLATLARFEIIDVHVHRQRSAEDVQQEDAPPIYSAPATASSCMPHNRRSLSQRACGFIGKWL